MTQGASKAVLAADFGLQVTYDWNWQVEVTLPSSYHGAVCGLCGNMDRNPSNDHAFPNGTLAPSIPIWGGSWRAPGWDPLCWDECQGSCPICAADQMEEYGGPGFCGPLAPGMGGPFATCHAHVAPDSFFKGCVLDVCLSGGAQDTLCQALAAYAAACQAAGITIKDWREQAGCGECGGSRAGACWGRGGGAVSKGLFWFHSSPGSLCSFPSLSVSLFFSLSLLALISVSPFDCLLSILHSLSPCLWVFLCLSLSVSISVPQSLPVSVFSHPILGPHALTPFSLSLSSTLSSTHRDLLP